VTLSDFADNVWMVLKLRGMKPFHGFPFGEGPLTSGTTLAAYWRHQLELKRKEGLGGDDLADVLSYLEAVELLGEEPDEVTLD